MMAPMSMTPLAEPFYRRVQDRLRRTLQRDGHDGMLMLGTGNCFRDQVLDLCATAISQTGVSPHVLEGSSLETIRHMVASGVGVTVMPASAVDDISPKDPLLRVRPFQEPVPTRRVGLVWRASYPRHQAVEIVRRALLDAKLPGTRPAAKR